MQVYSASIPSYIGTVLRYRDLIIQLVTREFHARYRGSALGILWSVLTPVCTVLVFSFVFGVVFKSKWGAGPESEGEFVPILFIGMLLHGIFAESISRAPLLIVGQASYVKKVVFPLELLPVVAVLQALINAAILFGVVLVVSIAIKGSIAMTLPLLPFVLVPYAIFVIGSVLFVSAIGVYLRDLTQLVNIITLVAMFFAPIFYPLTAVPEKYRYLLYLNPLTFTVEEARGVILFGTPPNWIELAIYGAAALAFAWIGLICFQKMRRGFADVI